MRPASFCASGTKPRSTITRRSPAVRTEITLYPGPSSLREVRTCNSSPPSAPLTVTGR